MLKPSNDKPKIDLLTTKIPDVIINKEALKKMKVYIDECSEEVGWLGTAFKIKGGFYVDDVMLFDQEVHSTTTEITPEGLSEFGEKLLQEPNGVDLWNSIKVWGHSHVNMSTFSSGQDDKQMELFGECGHDFFIRIIGNKKSDLRVDLYNYETGVIYNYVPWQLELTEEEIKIKNHIFALQEEIAALEKELELANAIVDEFKDEIKLELKEKVRPKVTAVTYGGGTGVAYAAWANQYKEKHKSKKKENEEIKQLSIKYKERPTDVSLVEDGLLLDLGDTLTIEDARDLLDLYGYDESEFTDQDVYTMMCYAYDLYGYYYYNDETYSYNATKLK